MAVGNQKQELRSVGGVRTKYSTIVDQFLHGHRDGKIFQDEPDRVVVGVSNYAGSTIVTITATFETVTIQYEVKNEMVGKHNLEWSFAKNTSEELILERMSQDIGRLNERMMGGSL